MQNEKENLFHSKFRFLTSQECNDDIKWTSSSSSDYEITSCKKKYDFDINKNRKRKRKKKVSKEMSNLDVTIIDSHNYRNSEVCREKSPILKSKRVFNKSPILVSKSGPPTKDVSVCSPILCSKSFQPKSPIVQTITSLNKTKRVRKRLSYDNSLKAEIVLANDSPNSSKTGIKNSVLIKDDIENISSKSEPLSSNGSELSLKAKVMERVKNFLDINFSSENTSQNISDTPTATDNSLNEDVDILSCRTPAVSHLQSIKLESANNSDNSSFNANTKKIKYKKGGLAYRLNTLLKKQNANICLWQHERFLALNSNFVIPKEEFIAFHIQNIDYKYGCYLINAVDLDCKKYFIIINKKYFSINVNVESVLKLYEPYTILPLDQEFKIIINVSKFECVALGS